MHNIWVVARHEYRRMVARRGFLLGVVGIPLLMVVIIGLSIFLTLRGVDDRPLGYVDRAGLITTEAEPAESVALVNFPSEAAAQAALESQEIQAYYVLAEDYPELRQVELFYWDEPPAGDVQEDFSLFLRQNLVAGLPAEVQTRLVEGPQVTVRSLDGRREIGDDSVVGFLLPLFAGFLFVFVVMTSAGYLLQVVANEKENRTVEILLTSLSPEQLIGGKALGLMGVALTQLTIWLLTILVGILAASRFFDWVGELRFPWDSLAVIALFFIPAYALVAGLMTAIGGSTSELRQGQQVAGLINLLFVAPMFLIAPLLSSPGSPLALFLTFFPPTSYLTVSLRWAMHGLPFWQLALSWAILTGTALFSVWASARIFRAGMLQYGQRLSLSGALRALRST